MRCTMTADQYLSGLYTLDDRIRRDIYRLDDLHDRAMSSGGSIRYDKDRVQTSTVNTAMDPVIDYVDAVAEIDRRLRGYASMRNNIISQIVGMHNHLHAVILYDIYVRDMSMRDTAREIGCGQRNIYNKYKDALNAFSDQYLTQTT